MQGQQFEEQPRTVSGPITNVASFQGQQTWQSTAPLSATYGSREPHTDPVVPARPYRRRGPRWLPPLIFLGILLFIAGGVLVSLRAAQVGTTAVALSTRTFPIAAHSTLKIHNDVGTVRIRAGKEQVLTVKATVDKDIFGMQSAVQYDQQGAVFTIGIDHPASNWLSTSGVALDITVPDGINLDVTVDSANVTVDGVQGVLNVKTDSGNVAVSDATLSGSGRIETDTGSIQFHGKLADNAHYTAQSKTGNMNITLPTDAHTHIAAKSDTGSIETTFQAVKTSPGGLGQEASGDINGASPTSSFDLESDSGSITISTGQ